MNPQHAQWLTNWTVALDGAQGNPYWRRVEIRAGDLLVGQLAACNAHGQGDAIVKLACAAPAMFQALELIARSDTFKGGTSADELRRIARSAVALAGG